ncbi:nucleotidyltransferase family protein [Ruegeria arenilitoris]|uniref:nucleotidyltransferase family protein n=1 Tax=Ruegeria arenilitoris TaxID=1173585 RepID=UPI0034649076
MTAVPVGGKVAGMEDIPVILLAAGSSRRMGGVDKLMQIVDGQPLIRRSAETARAVGPVIVALPPAPHPRHTALSGMDLEVVSVPDADEGMNASLRRAVAQVPVSARAAMILLADLPELTSDDLRAVLRSVTEHPDKLIWRGASSDGVPGHPVIFDRSLFADLAHLTGDGGAQTIVLAHLDQVHLQPLPGQNAILDLDTPQAWAEWRKKQRSQK